LNEQRIAGARFVPIHFSPKTSVYKGEDCGGVNIIITDRDLFRPVLAGVQIAVALRKLYPSQWKIDDYLRLMGNSDTLERLKRGESAAELVRAWSPPLEEFKKARSEVLLYP
jgi:uncharacterized protein YbbC (DUF1343 family)